MIVEDYLEESQRDLDARIFDGDFELFESIGELQAELEKKTKALEKIVGFRHWLKQAGGMDIHKIAEQALKNESEVKELEKHRWIPVTERLPENNRGLSLVCDVSGLGNPFAIIWYNNQWLFPDKETKWPCVVTHWKLITLPEQALESEVKDGM